MHGRGLDTSIQFVRGVGPSRAALFGRLGIATVRDLLDHYPVRHDDRTTIVPIADLKDGMVQTFKGVVRGSAETRPRRGLVITRVTVSDGTGSAHLVWFNQPYMSKRFRPGAWFLFTGKVERRFGRVQVTGVEYEDVDAVDRASTGCLAPVYGLTEGLTQRTVRLVVKAALEQFRSSILDPLPVGVRASRGLVDLVTAYEHVHFPTDAATLERARRRLAFDEFFYLQVAMAWIKKRSSSGARGFAHSPPGPLVQAVLDSLPFKLTAAQSRAVREIQADLQGEVPMNRLLMGDVGSGKTVVAALALAQAVESGYQGALMAPTEILAEQHWENLGRILGPAGIRVVLLTGSRAQAEREQALLELAHGKAGVAVGTHALIQEGVSFAGLSLVVTDEQHRFGVRQRAALQSKGTAPDVLVMTATPIPRTLALTVFGDLDVSVIDELPPGRKPVKTTWRPAERRTRVYEWLRKQVDAGRQAYVVCPLIDNSEAVSAQAATDLRDELAGGALAGVPIGLVHGRMKAGDKREVMESFKNGRTRVLVATTVIEVGVDVPSATIMIIEGADRFGLAQLHQLRGRVGRGADQSYCVLLCDSLTPEAQRRMEVMASTTDGFKIAEADLEMRGPGDLLGVRQHGIPDFRMANPIRDAAVLEAARKDALSIIENDPFLDCSAGAAVRLEVARRFPDLGLFKVG